MVTVEMVAKMAGVSRGTVDRVLHHRGEVKSETAERVRLRTGQELHRG